MPRLPRVIYANAVYHVTARGNGRATIFFEDADRHRFLRQLCDSLETESVFPMDAMRENRYAIGGEAFVEETQKRFEQQRTGSPRDEDIALPAVTVDIHTVDTYLARHYRIEPEGLKAHGKRAGVAKYVAVELACRLTGQSGRAVGMHYGGISGAAVGNIRRKVREGTIDILPAVERLLLQLRKV